MARASAVARTRALRLRESSLFRRFYRDRHYLALLLPGIAYFVIFRYVPIYGVTLAFKDFVAADGILANAIAPGVVDTPLTAQIKQQPDWYGAYADKTMLRRWARPEEIAGAVLYLASEASSYTTGSVMFVDGGWTAADGRFDPFGG
jgi:hypothetical protein